MRISKKLIAQICLPIYKKVLEEGKKDNVDKFSVRLKKYNVDCGICLLYDSLPEKVGYIYNFSPLRARCKVDKYGQQKSVKVWYYKVPNLCKTKKEMIQCIEKRMAILHIKAPMFGKKIDCP